MTEPIAAMGPREKAGFGLDPATVAAVRDAAVAEDAGRLRELLRPLHPADIADLLEQIDDEARRTILALGMREIDGRILSELDESLREEVLEDLAPETLVAAVRGLESDDVVDLLEDLGAPGRAAVLERLAAGERMALEHALAYPEGSAGRLMQRELVRAPEHWTVGEMIDVLRAETAHLPEQFYHVFLVDPKMRPAGQVALGRLLASPRPTRLRDITEAGMRRIPADQPEAEVAYAFNQYHLISAPVVDAEERLVGVITMDDAMTVLEEEAEEDLLRLAGVTEGSLAAPVRTTIRQRFPWLLVNLGTAILASLVISLFEDAITQMVALAVLMPIVASMGGNAATQSLTVAVRALATKDLTAANLWRFTRREILVGLANGAIFALVMGGIGIAWFGNPGLGAVIAIAMVVNLLSAGLAGVLIPVLLDSLRVDPALASGTFVTTVTDVVGFFAFLGFAAAVLL